MFYYLGKLVATLWSTLMFYFVKKKSQSGSTVCVLFVLTLAPWAPLCSKRSHIQLDRREVWRQIERVPYLPRTSFLQVYLVPARRQLMRQWARDLITCRWMKLEFSSCKTNTMWPCWVSDCIIGVLYWSREEGLKEWANFSQNMVRNVVYLKALIDIITKLRILIQTIF